MVSLAQGPVSTANKRAVSQDLLGQVSTLLETPTADARVDWFPPPGFCAPSFPKYHHDLGKKVDVGMISESQIPEMLVLSPIPGKTSLRRGLWCQTLEMKEQTNAPAWQRSSKALRQELRNPSLSSQGEGLLSETAARLPYCGFQWVHVCSLLFQKDSKFPGERSMVLIALVPSVPPGTV